MSALTGRTQNDTYFDLLHFENSNLGFDATLRNIESGAGATPISSLQLSTISARFAGTLVVVGVASFDVAPNVGGSDVWYPGNDGPGSGLDADTLDGLHASSFASAADPLTITGAWEFQTPPLFSRANNLELARFQDTSNNIQMQAIFNADLDFSLIPGTGGSFTAADRLYWDSTESRWSTVNGFNFTGVAAVLNIGPTSTIEADGSDLILVSGAGEVILDSSVGSILLTSAVDVTVDLPGDVIITSTGAGFEVDVETLISLSSTTDQVLISAGSSLDMDGATSVSLAALGGDLELEGSDEVTITNGTGLVFQTQDPAAATTTSAALLRDGGSTLRDVGFNVMPNDDQAGNFSLGVTNVGHKERYTGIGGHTAVVTDEANIPDGGTWVIVNAGTDVLLINITTLTWYDGSGTIQTGARTLAIAGVCTITKRIDGQYEIWGAGLT